MITSELSKEKMEEEILIYQLKNGINIASNSLKRFRKENKSENLTLSFDGKKAIYVLNVEIKQILEELMVNTGTILSPNSELYYKSILNKLIEKNSNKIFKKHVNEFYLKIKKLDEKISKYLLQIDKKTCEECYNHVLINILWADDIEARKEEIRIKQQKNGVIILFIAHWYAIQLTDLLLQFFSYIKKKDLLIEHERQNYCIYCKTTIGQFSKYEHTLSQSLGNSSSILPRGWCCDKCNQTFSIFESKAEKILPFSFAKIFYVPFTKKGKFASVSFLNQKIKKQRPNEMTIRYYGSKEKFDKSIIENDSEIHMKQEYITQNMDYESLVKILLKFALGAISLEKGRNYVLSNEKFDPIRRYILQNKPFYGRLLIKKESDVNNLRLELIFNNNESYAILHYFSFILYFSLQPIKEKKELKDLDNEYLIYTYGEKTLGN